MLSVTRHAKPRVLEALGDTRIVVIQGGLNVEMTGIAHRSA